MGENSTYKLIINLENKYSGNCEERLLEVYKKDLSKFEILVTEIGEARGWCGNPRYDLILEEGIRAYLSGDVDKRE